MKYYEEMQSKWGFNDGDSTPAGIEAYRLVYVTAMNYLLEEHESEVRVIAFNRSGMHNDCLIVEITLEFAAFLQKNFTRDQLSEGLTYLDTKDVGVPDEAYYAALNAAMEMDLDDYVEVTVEAKLDELADFLTNYPTTVEETPDGA